MMSLKTEERKTGWYQWNGKVCEIRGLSRLKIRGWGIESSLHIPGFKTANIEYEVEIVVK